MSASLRNIELKCCVAVAAVLSAMSAAACIKPSIHVAPRGVFDGLASEVREAWVEHRESLLRITSGKEYSVGQYLVAVEFVERVTGRNCHDDGTFSGGFRTRILNPTSKRGNGGLKLTPIASCGARSQSR
jgi:hypothetical protein